MKRLRGAASSLPRLRLWLLAASPVLVVACTSVPGESVAPGSVQRDVRGRVLSQAAQARPACKAARVVDTQVLELHGDGKVALERWTVDSCGERIDYRVAIPPPASRAAAQIRRE